MKSCLAWFNSLHNTENRAPGIIGHRQEHIFAPRLLSDFMDSASQDRIACPLTYERIVSKRIPSGILG